jgi:2-polyprenyl-6-methoxyphenol hydroxylase-like FAD-dependent oxidoreductase
MSAAKSQMDIDVAIVGAGPTGLLLAAELAMRGGK